MRPWQTHESDSLSDTPDLLPGQWLFYFLTTIAILAALFLYFFAVHNHLYHQHYNAVRLQPSSVEIDARIPALKLPAKLYTNEKLPVLAEVLTYETDKLETILTYIAPIFAIFLIILLILSVRLVRIAKIRTHSLYRINQALEKEIAERQEIEATQKKLERALLHGQKLQAIGTLAGGIAHDFNNLLYAIIGYVEMAQEDTSKDSLLYNNLGKVLEAAHRGQDLISRILTFSRRQHHEFKEVHLKSTITSVLSLLKPTVLSSVIINCDFEISDDFCIWGDQTQLHQVLVNIINNAVDAMDGEGTIDIHIVRVPAGDELFKQFPELPPANHCKIDIKDSGYGMDKSTIDRIFEPFFTTKEVGKGTGLGLATVHAIIEEHQGEIIAASELGHGSTFTIFLPEFTPTETIKGAKHG